MLFIQSTKRLNEEKGWRLYHTWGHFRGGCYCAATYPSADLWFRSVTLLLAFKVNMLHYGIMVWGMLHMFCCQVISVTLMTAMLPGIDRSVNNMYHCFHQSDAAWLLNVQDVREERENRNVKLQTIWLNTFCTALNLHTGGCLLEKFIKLLHPDTAAKLTGGRMRHRKKILFRFAQQNSDINTENIPPAHTPLD